MVKVYRLVNKILLAIKDCEPETISSPIVQKTLELANDCSSKVHIIHVVPPQRSHPYNVDTETFCLEVSKAHRHKHDFLLHLEKHFRPLDIEATAQLIQGSIIHAILQQSERLNAELIILGYQKHGALYKALMGDAIERLLAKSSCPIMFVPA